LFHAEIKTDVENPDISYIVNSMFWWTW